MMSHSRMLIRLVLAASGFLFSLPARAAEPVNAALVPGTNGVALPALPKLHSPVDTFRQLLAMSPGERRQYLTNRPPAAQKQILAKLHEYQLLKPEERELRLRATELQWYLMPLMSMPRTNRTARLALI